MSGIVALACSLDTKPELCDYYAPITPFLETQNVLGILKVRYYVIAAALSPGPKALC